MFIATSTIALLVEQSSNYTLFISFFVPVLGGEVAILFLAFIAGQGAIPWWEVLVGSVLGMVMLDTMWFFLPRSAWAERLRARFSDTEKYRALAARLDLISHHNDIVILFLSKALIGTRILVLLYLSARSIPFQKFFFFNAIASSLWASILVGIGWYAGVGFYTVSAVYDNFTAGALIVALAIGVFYGALWYIRKLITKK